MIVIDSNIWIFGELENAAEHAEALKKYEEAIRNDRIVINAIIVSEVFHKLNVLVNSVAAANKINNILNGEKIDFIEFTAENLMRAVKLARDFKMRINDAMIAQQALETGASVLTDNVKDFKKVGALKVIPLRSAH